MRTTRLMTGATMAVAGLLLTGCGSASPGVAATVGDEELSVRQVDAAAQEMCTALGDQFEAQATTLPMSFVRQGTLQLMILREQATQIAAEYGVEPGSAYLNDLSQRRGAAAAMPEEARDTYLELTGANALATDILEQVGRMELEDAGVDDPTVDQVTQAGTDLFNRWPDSHGIDIDPRYGLESRDGTLVPIDTNTSVAIGDTARSGLATEPDTAYAKTLPMTHRCG